MKWVTDKISKTFEQKTGVEFWKSGRHRPGEALGRYRGDAQPPGEGGGEQGVEGGGVVKVRVEGGGGVGEEGVVGGGVHLAALPGRAGWVRVDQGAKRSHLSPGRREPTGPKARWRGRRRGRHARPAGRGGVASGVRIRLLSSGGVSEDQTVY